MIEKGDRGNIHLVGLKMVHPNKGTSVSCLFKCLTKTFYLSKMYIAQRKENRKQFVHFIIIFLLCT